MGRYKWGYKSPNMGYDYGFQRVQGLGFQGSYKWGEKSPNMAEKYSYPTYNPTYNYP